MKLFNTGGERWVDVEQMRQGALGALRACGGLPNREVVEAWDVPETSNCKADFQTKLSTVKNI